MSERLLEAFREQAERVVSVPPFEPIASAGRSRRRRRHAVVGVVSACVVGVAGLVSVVNGTDATPRPAEPPDTSSVTPYPGPEMTTLERGTYELAPSPDPDHPVVRFTVPAGWNSWLGPNKFEGLGPAVTSDPEVNEAILGEADWYAGLLVLDVRDIARRGCSIVDVSEGDTRTFSTLLPQLPRLSLLSEPETTVRFGRMAVHMRLRERGGPACPADYFFQTAQGYIGAGEAGRTYDAWIIDTDGRPILVWASWGRRTPDYAVEELLRIVDSIEVHD